MKRTVFTTALVFACLFAMQLHAQSYLPFPGLQTSHFNYPDSAGAGAGVLSVRVDSIYPQGNATVYLFNQIVRPISPDDTIITCGGDWISDQPGYAIVHAHKDNIFGSHCTVHPDGKAEFHTQAGDTFVIETQANVGDMWTFHGAAGVTAEVISIGSEQVWGVADSVKLIQLSNGTEIALSKTLGIVRGTSFLPLRSLESGDRLSTNLTLWGVEETGLGNALPGFDEIFGLLEQGDEYQTSSFAYGSSGTTNRKDAYEIVSKNIGTNSISYQVNQESFSIRENYIFSGGSSFDSTYRAPTAATVEYLRADYPYIGLVQGETYPRGNNGGANVASQTTLLADGRIKRSFAYFTDYDPCADVFYYFPFDYYEEEEFEEGLGKVYRWSGGNGYSSNFDFGCYNTAVAGMEGNCLNLAQLAGLDTGGPQPPQNPGGLPTGIWGNGNGDVLWLVPGDAAQSLTVWDVTGRKVMEMPVKDRVDPYAIDVTSWRSGVYVFSVERVGGQIEVFRTGLIR